MLSSISSYFSAAESPLHVAMRKGQFEKASTLVNEGADLAKTDANGYTVIDYAVFEGQAKHLPTLFSTAAPEKPIAAQVNKELEALANSTEFEGLKKILASFTPDQLADKTSEQYQKLTLFIKERADIQMGTLGTKILHLIALFGNAEFFKVVLEFFPELASQRDSKGNSALHYAALNKDEGCFVQLVKSGSNVFDVNTNGTTGLGLLVNRLQKEDPLNWDKRDLYIFISTWIPVALEALRLSGLLPEEAIASFFELENAVVVALWVAASISCLSTLLGQFNSTPKKALFSLAYLTNFLPVLSLPMRTYIAYTYASTALQSFKTAWQHSYRRPFKATCIAAVRTSNAVEQAGILYAHFQLLQTHYRRYVNPFSAGWEAFEANANQECGKTPKMIILDDNATLQANPDYKKYVDCGLDAFSKTYNETLKDDPVLNRVFEKVFRPAVSEAAYECPTALADSGESAYTRCLWTTYFHILENLVPGNFVGSCSEYTSPKNLSKMTAAKRIEAAKGSPTCIQAALDMIGQATICEKNPAKSCRALKKEMHPDRHLDKHFYFHELAVALNLGCDTLKAEYKGCV